ncbi:nitrate/nitrite transporter NrtS [Thalassotalea hakodatensis]|uniref:nitrate/nitrite transporter NrtS n=1 Tax=Thalassotalea hakodatensis TaxID=3030492 RepID=UPI002572EB16|nr:nitrate/nitrite transporter NrtS [Thalassotalea hakodatensis]
MIHIRKQYRTAIIISMVVGTILTLVNQSDVIFSDQPLNWFKVIITYIVPFCVSVYSSYATRIETTMKR